LAVYTPLSEADEAELAGLFDLPLPLRPTPIATGSENSTYRLETARGRFALTLVESQTADVAERRLRWVQRLHRQGLPVAAPRASRRGRLVESLAGRPVVVTPWLAGEHPLRPTLDQCREIGAFLGRLHTTALDAGVPTSAPLQPLIPRALAQATRLTPRQRRALSTAAAAAGFAALPRGPVHGDLFRDNALFRGPRLHAVLDFYAAGAGTLALDLAVTALDWCRGDKGLDPVRLAALWAGYQALRPLRREERRAWPALLRHAAAGFWAMRILQRQRSPAMGAGKPPEAMLALLQSLSPPLEIPQKRRA